MKQLSIPRGAAWQWCYTCSKFRWHQHGTCVMSGFHADRVCACGRQCAGDRCSACLAEAEL